MNTLGIALAWCIVQVTLIGLLAAALYLLVRRLRPAAAGSVVLTALAIVVMLSLLVPSPWPRWTIHNSPLHDPLRGWPGDGRGARAAGLDEPPVTSAPSAEKPTSEHRGVEAAGLENFALAPENGAGSDDAALIKNQPPGTTTRWQVLLDDLIQPATTGAWHWPGVMAVLLLAAMSCGLGWLLLGVAAVRWQRLRSRPVVDRNLLELVDTLRAELACRRPVEVRQSDDLATAATIGWRRPVVLLPADWTTWTVEQRRAVLAHEVAHARSNDFIALLVGQFGLALHFYHPLLHWLIARLRLEQELAADAEAAGVSGGRQQYLATIAELALRQQDQPLLWPARTFFFSRTTFLRRIAMLKDSKLRFGRPSPVTRLITVGVVLLCGLLVAGLRGTAGQQQASAEDSVKAVPVQSKHAADAPTGPAAVADRSIDTTYMIEKASLIVVMRPAAVFSRPELAPLAKALEASGNLGLNKEIHLADVRQITAIMPEADIPSGPRDLLVLQWIKPTAEADFAKQLAGKDFTVKEFHGKKLYVPSRDRGGKCLMRCDNYTEVEAGSEQAMGVYLAGKLGVLPKWLPAEAWESFRDDHVVIAADTAMMRRELKPLLGYSPPLAQAALLSVSSLWEDTTCLAAGARLRDQLAAHAWAAAKDADSAAKLQRTAEALKTLAGSLVKNVRAPSKAGREPQPIVPSALLDEADRLLGNTKSQLEGNSVQLQTSVKVDTARLDVLVSAIAAATQPADASTKKGMMALVEDFFHHNYRDITSRETLEWGDFAKTADGNFSIRYKYRCSYWWGEPKIVTQIFTFDPQGQFVSADYAEKSPHAPPAQVHQVHKKVADFPDREDMTTPEAAYASIHRAYVAEGDAAFLRLSVPTLAAHMQAGVKKPLPKKAADRLLGAEVIEVHEWGGTHAVVIALEEDPVSGRGYMDMRWLDRVDGRWLNHGNDSRRTLEDARQKIQESVSH